MKGLKKTDNYHRSNGINTMVSVKNKSVLIIAAGPTVSKYWNKIEKFIKDTNPVIIGCNNIMHIIKPDIHFWGSPKRFKKYGHLLDKKSVLMFSAYISETTIKKYWKGKYETFNYKARSWKYGSDDKKSYQYKRCCMRVKNGKMYGCFYDTATKAAFWSYLHGASEINFVGNDGYTFYTKQQLDSKEERQHCYGKGMTDGYTYLYCRKKDWDKYKTLRLLFEYGIKKHKFGFKILTPTIYEDFCDLSILKIDPDVKMQKWIEPSSKEYKDLYFKSKEKRKLSKKHFYEYNG